MVQVGVKNFTVKVDDASRADLRRRLAAVRYAPPVLTGRGGIGPGELARLIDFWRDEFEWEALEAELGRYDSFHVEVEGAKLHVMRADASTGGERPTLVLLHGWPGSPVEFFDLIPRLTEPERFGAPSGIAFNVVVPELPGFGWSTLPQGAVEPSRMADLLAEALKKLGINQYGLVGGDIGAHVLQFLAARHPDRVIGVHTHHPSLHPLIHDDAPLSETEREYLREKPDADPGRDEYAALQQHRPDTLAAALIDSPAGLAAWLLERYRDWSGDGTIDAYDLRRLAATMSWYWYSGAIGSSFRAYTDDHLTPPAPVVTVPAAISLTPEDRDYPREFAGRTYTDIRQWRDPRRAGHFYALEDPQNLAQDLRSFFSAL